MENKKQKNKIKIYYEITSLTPYYSILFLTNLSSRPSTFLSLFLSFSLVTPHKPSFYSLV